MVPDSEIRRPVLPEGWYPGSRAQVVSTLETWCGSVEAGKDALAVVAPHAGWFFSGRTAARAISQLAAADTVVVAGGHLAQGSPILYAPENAVETPLGMLETDAPLLSALFDALRDAGIPPPQPDTRADNSVEVLLPMVAYFQPGARLIWLRCPPRQDSKELGAALSTAAVALGRKVACIGSTDLTHYGPNYGFMPAGSGEKAERWVRSINDKAFIDALLAMNAETALSLALKRYSACSAGAALAALGYAISSGAAEARLVEYTTSLEMHEADSFVGYAGIAFF